MLWPVIDPLARYHFAKKLKEGGKPYPDLVDTLIKLHDRYWKTEDAMAEGNPALALKRGERVEMPTTLYIQGTADIVHPRVDLDMFVANYRKAGRHLALEMAGGEGEGFFIKKPSSPAPAPPIEEDVGFVHQHVRRPPARR